MMGKKLQQTLLIFLIVAGGSCVAKTSEDSTKVNHELMAGLRFQRYAGFYWVNGLSLEFRSDKVWKHKMGLAINYQSSRLGTALASNAIPYSEINLSAIRYFRTSRSLQPLLRFNAGFAIADYGSAEFSSIPNKSALASLEFGAAYLWKSPLRVTLSFGYNIITGNGVSGLGVLYPLYAQASVFYRIRL